MYWRQIINTSTAINYIDSRACFSSDTSVYHSVHWVLTPPPPAPPHKHQSPISCQARISSKYPQNLTKYGSKQNSKILIFKLFSKLGEILMYSSS